MHFLCSFCQCLRQGSDPSSGSILWSPVNTLHMPSNLENIPPLTHWDASESNGIASWQSRSYQDSGFLSILHSVSYVCVVDLHFLNPASLASYLICPKKMTKQRVPLEVIFLLVNLCCFFHNFISGENRMDFKKFSKGYAGPQLFVKSYMQCLMQVACQWHSLCSRCSKKNVSTVA